MKISSNYQSIISSLSRDPFQANSIPVGGIVPYGYSRVSSKDQDVEPQNKTLMDMGVRKKNIFTDHCSGDVTRRQGLTNLFNKISGRNAVLFVSRADRLSRNFPFYVSIIEKLNDMGIRIFTFSQEELSFRRSDTLMLTNLYGLMAHMERSLLLERIKDTSKHKKVGRPKIDISPALLVKMLEYRKLGKSVIDISNEFGIPVPTLYKVLKRAA